MDEKKSKKIKLLIVDDEQTLCDLYKESLEEIDSTIAADTVYHPEKALELIKNNEYHILITDLRMPGMDGIELTKKAKIIQPKLEVFIITGHGDMENVIDAMRIGVNNYIQKPISFQMLHIEIIKSFEKTELRKELEVSKNQLKRANEHLLNVNKDMEEMVYIASHDLKAPLISIEAYIYEIISNMQKTLDSESTFAFERIKANIVRLKKIINSLLDLSRINTQKNKLETIGFCELIDNIEEELNLMMEKNKVSIHKKDLGKIYGDKQRLSTVFRNLITNSIKYEAQNIEIGKKNDIIFIKDDGIGIPPGQLKKVFTAGERLKANNADGVGMGLTFCEKVIKSHNGKIWAESEGKGKGTTIFIALNNAQNGNQSLSKS